MLDHVEVRASDLEASRAFYVTVLGAIGIEQTGPDRWDDFALAQADGDHPATRGLHIGFAAPSRALADEFWRVGTEAGYRDDGAPGPRTEYGDDYYGAFLLDPDGNSAEAVHHRGLRPPGHIDHLWIRVADVAAAKRHYQALAPHAGLRLGDDTPERVQFIGQGGSFSLVEGTPTENARLVFPDEDPT
jgi:catechol 2,3-dioxygenase-like lactoylglutathione lyase family enzyme